MSSLCQTILPDIYMGTLHKVVEVGMPFSDKSDIELSVNEITIKGFRVNQHIDSDGV